MNLRVICLFLLFGSLCSSQTVSEYPITEGNPATLSCRYRSVQWVITTKNYTRVVATCTTDSCNNKEPYDYVASGPQSGNNGLSLLLVQSIQRPGLDAQCKVNSTFTADSWRLNAIVNPTQPQCNNPVPQSDGVTVNVLCQTLVYPRAACNIYLLGQSNVTSNPTTYNHTWSTSANLTLTTCVLSFSIKDVVWNSSAMFRVAVFPDVNFGSTMLTYSNWSLVFVQVTDVANVISLTANDQDGYLVVSSKMIVTLRCVAVGPTGTSFSLYNKTTNQVLSSTKVPNTLEYVLKNGIQGSLIIGCHSASRTDLGKLIHVYVGPGYGPVTQFTANGLSDLLAVSQGSNVIMSCEGDEISGETLLLTYHYVDGTEAVMDKAGLPAVIHRVYHNIPCGNLSYMSCRLGNDYTTEKLINMSVECLKSTCCDSSFPIIPVAAGIASGVAMILLIIIIFCLCRRCRRKNSERSTPKAERSVYSTTASKVDRVAKVERNHYHDPKKTKNQSVVSLNPDANQNAEENMFKNGAYSTALVNRDRNQPPKRMSILRSSSRKKLAKSVDIQSLSSHSEQTPSHNEDVYHVNLGYDSSSSSLYHPPSTLSSSSVVPPTLVSLNPREYAVPDVSYNRGRRKVSDGKLQSNIAISPKIQPLSSRRGEYDLPYSTEV